MFGLWKKSEQGAITFQISMKGETHWDLHANASGHKEITMQIAGKSKLVRFGPWKDCRQTPIIRHIARKCKLPTFGVWKKYEQAEITLQMSGKGETNWELPANASGQREITLHTAGKSKLVRFGP